MSEGVYRTELIGGGLDALDGISVNDLTDKDFAIVSYDNGGTIEEYHYRYYASATDSESSPEIIVPDDRVTTGAWKRSKGPTDPGDIVPTGAIFAFPTNSAPTGYLACDGSAVSRSTYADLFALISDDYGSGDGSTTFNVPDYRGQFLRGWDNAAGNDPDSSSRTDRGDGTAGDYVGTRQSDMYKSHSHSYNGANLMRQGGATPMFAAGLINSYWQTPTVGSSGGNETRPKNVNVLYCIKI